MARREAAALLVRVRVRVRLELGLGLGFWRLGLGLGFWWLGLGLGRSSGRGHASQKTPFLPPAAAAVGAPPSRLDEPPPRAKGLALVRVRVRVS